MLWKWRFLIRLKEPLVISVHRALKTGNFCYHLYEKYFNNKFTCKNKLSLQKIFYFSQAVSDPTGNFTCETLSTVHVIQNISALNKPLRLAQIHCCSDRFYRHVTMQPITL